MALVLLLVIILFYLINKYLYTYWSRRNIFQVNPTFLIGNLGALLTFKKNLGDFFAELYGKFKNKKFIGVYLFYKPALIITDPEVIHDVLIKNLNSFTDRPMPIDAAKKYPLVGHLFNVRGQKWRDLRIKLTPTFTSGKLKVMFPIIHDCAEVLQVYVGKELEKGRNVMEFRDLFARLTTDIISSIAFGIENDSINDRENIFRKIGMKLFEPSLRRIFSNFFVFISPELFAKSGVDPFGKELTNFMFDIVRQTVEYREKNKVERNDFMQLLINLKNEGYVKGDKNEEKLENYDEDKKVSRISMNDLTANVFLFFVAGFETSSSTASFCLYELCKNPDKQRKAQNEIDRVLKAHDNKLTYDSLAEMKYVDCCVDETLRKHPIGSFLFRVATQDYKFPDSDVVVEKGTSIYIPVLGLHRDPEIFENPLEFKPERFLNSGNGTRNLKGLFYLAFGDGPRNCIGARMGKLQSKIGLVVLLQKFNFEYADKSLVAKEIEYDPKLTIPTPKEEIMIKVSRR